MKIDEKCIDAWILIGHSQLKENEFRSARKAFEHVIRELDRHDSFALCCTGNLCLRFAVEDPKQKDIHLKRAVEFFCIALRHEPKNVRAAAGIAIAYAIGKRFEVALEIFHQLQGQIADDKDILLNAAYIQVILGKIDAAVHLYEVVMKKDGHVRDPQVLAAAARAHYIGAKTNLDPEGIKKALVYLLEAAALEPSNNVHRYNIALLRQQNAQILTQLPPENRHLRTIEALKHSLEGLEESEQLFSELAKVEAPKDFNAQLATDRAKFSVAVKRQIEKKIHEAETLAKMRQIRLEEIKEKQLENERLAAEKLALQQREKAERDEQIEASRKALQAKIREENEKVKQWTDADRKRAPRSGDEDSDTQAPRKAKRSKKIKHEAGPTQQETITDRDPTEEIEDDQIGRKKATLSSAIIQDDSD